MKDHLNRLKCEQFTDDVCQVLTIPQIFPFWETELGKDKKK